jgi:hypothetical protein
VIGGDVGGDLALSPLIPRASHKGFSVTIIGAHYYITRLNEGTDNSDHNLFGCHFKWCFLEESDLTHLPSKGG